MIFLFCDCKHMRHLTESAYDRLRKTKKRSLLLQLHICIYAYSSIDSESLISRIKIRTVVKIPEIIKNEIIFCDIFSYDAIAVKIITGFTRPRENKEVLCIFYYFVIFIYELLAPSDFGLEISYVCRFPSNPQFKKKIICNIILLIAKSDYVCFFL